MPAAGSLPPQPTPNQPVLEPKTDIFAVLYRNYWLAMDRMFRTANFGPLPQAADDTAAAAAGVPVGGLYANGNAVQVRLV